MTDCPSGFHFDAKINACVQDIQQKWRKGSGGSHFFRNIGLFGIGFLFGFLSLWQYGWILIVPFGILLAVTFFLDSRPYIYPLAGFIIGIIAIYWSQISGIISFLGRMAGGW